MKTQVWTKIFWALGYRCIVAAAAFSLLVYTPRQILLRPHPSTSGTLICFSLVGVLTTLAWAYGKASSDIAESAYSDAKVEWPEFGRRMDKFLSGFGFKIKD